MSKKTTGMSWFSRWLNYLSTRRYHREAIKQLNMLSDAELRDIGINRADIDRIVWLEQDKQNRGSDNDEK